MGDRTGGRKRDVEGKRGRRSGDGGLGLGKSQGLERKGRWSRYIVRGGDREGKGWRGEDSGMEDWLEQG